LQDQRLEIFGWCVQVANGLLLVGSYPTAQTTLEPVPSMRTNLSNLRIHRVSHALGAVAPKDKEGQPILVSSQYRRSLADDKGLFIRDPGVVHPVHKAGQHGVLRLSDVDGEGNPVPNLAFMQLGPVAPHLAPDSHPRVAGDLRQTRRSVPWHEVGLPCADAF